MSNDITAIIIEKLGLIGVLIVVIWFLFRKILDQYGERIKQCEAENAECRKDRKDLHNKIEAIQQAEIDRLRRE